MAFLMARIIDLPVTDAGALFAAALAVHVLAALVAVITGAVAATARKRPGRHPRFGTIYYGSLSVVFASATTLSAVMWGHDWYLFIIAAVAFGAGTLGYLARKRRWAGWQRVHALSFGLSYIALLTGFYVDNGPHLPLLRHLPHVAFWLGPSFIGWPLILRSLAGAGVRSEHQSGRARRVPAG